MAKLRRVQVSCGLREDLAASVGSQSRIDRGGIAPETGEGRERTFSLFALCLASRTGKNARPWPVLSRREMRMLCRRRYSKALFTDEGTRRDQTIRKVSRDDSPDRSGNRGLRESSLRARKEAGN
mgnify:CR=1 FL=1